ncbi:hypothetical protein ACE10Z_28020 [Bradyrhizobium sp. Pha-3]|uniref:hypothetical protein n=1 Tax=Bradyrhizobium sp. Pha-3 TaxID=208375 RepID=UPI0035D46A03
MRDQLVDQDLASGAGVAFGHESSLRHWRALAARAERGPTGYDRREYGARPKQPVEGEAASSHAIGNGQPCFVIDFRRADDRRQDRSRQPAITPGIIFRSQTHLAAGFRMKCPDAGQRDRFGIAPRRINLALFLPKTPPSTMDRPRGRREPLLPRETIEDKRVAARATTAWHNLHTARPDLHDRNHEQRAPALPYDYGAAIGRFTPFAAGSPRLRSKSTSCSSISAAFAACSARDDSGTNCMHFGTELESLTVPCSQKL